MGRLALAELRHGIRWWLPLGAVSVAATACLVLGLGIALGPTRSASPEVSQLGLTLALSSAMSAIIAIRVVGAVSARTQRLEIAVWLLAGLRPRQAGRVVQWEITLASMAGGVVGTGLASATWPWWVGLLEAAGLPARAALPGAPPVPAVVAAVVITAVASLVGSIRAGSLTRTLRPLAVLRRDDADPRPNRPTPGHIIVGALLALGVVACYAAVAVIEPSSSSAIVQTSVTGYLVCAIALVVLVVALGPRVLRWVLAAWTGLIPRRVSLTWYLARNRARENSGFSAAVVVPLAVATGTVGALYGWVAQMRAAAKALGQPFQGNGLPIAQVVALTGGPVLVAAVATAGVLFATSANTVRDTVLLRVAGASRGRLALGAIFESLMYAVTSALAAALALALNSAAFALALRLGPVPGAGWVGLPLPPFVIVGGGLVLMLAVALPTAAWVANRQPMRILGAD